MIDESSLFLHVLAATGILGGGIAQILAGFRVRAATRASEVATWARFTRGAGRLILASAILSLLTGGHLAGAVWTTDAMSGFEHPFITLGLAGLLLLAPVGPMVGGKRLRALVEAAESVDGSADEALLVRARSSALWGPIHSLVGVAVGLVALMVYKPGWGVGTVVLLVTFGAGWAVGAALAPASAASR